MKLIDFALALNPKQVRVYLTETGLSLPLAFYLLPFAFCILLSVLSAWL